MTAKRPRQPKSPTPSQSASADKDTRRPARMPNRALLKSLWVNPAITALAGVVLLGSLGAAYYLLGKSTKAESRFFKETYDEHFQFEADKQPKMPAEQKALPGKIMQEQPQEKQRPARDEKEQQQALKERQSIDEEQKKEQQRTVQQKLDKIKKQREAERLAGIEAEKKKEQERIEKIKIEKKMGQARLAAIEAEKKAEAERIAEIEEKKKNETLRMDAIASVKKNMAAADAHRQAKNYLQAKTGYEAALKTIENSRFKNDSVLKEQRGKIEAALRADDILYGSKGYVQHKGQWMTPEALDLALYSEGFVKYKGAFRDHGTLKNRIKTLSAPLMRKYLTQKYSGQTVHAKNIKFQKVILTRNNENYAEYSVYHKWEVWTFKGMDEGVCMLDIRYTVSTDKWSLIKGCE